MLEAFLQNIQEKPHEDSLWLILADWLDEHDDPRGELIRLQHALRQPEPVPQRQAREDRLRQLVALGVPSCLPCLTNSIGMKLTLIPPGSFLMGSAEDEPDRGADEGPQHPITLDQAFYLGTYPVTQGEYQRVQRANPSHFRRGGPEHPVEHVTWSQADEFCRRLSALAAEKSAGRVYRLPTEAEWEYACRAGTTTPFWFGSSAAATQANFHGGYPYGAAPRGPTLERTTRVGSYPPNAFGLYDMHGNVCEWCRDWYTASFYEKGELENRQVQYGWPRRVLRGGCWAYEAKLCRSAARSGGDPGFHLGTGGFRVAAIQQT